MPPPTLKDAEDMALLLNDELADPADPDGAVFISLLGKAYRPPFSDVDGGGMPLLEVAPMERGVDSMGRETWLESPGLSTHCAWDTTRIELMNALDAGHYCVRLRGGRGLIVDRTNLTIGQVPAPARAKVGAMPKRNADSGATDESTARLRRELDEERDARQRALRRLEDEHSDKCKRLNEEIDREHRRRVDAEAETRKAQAEVFALRQELLTLQAHTSAQRDLAALVAEAARTDDPEAPRTVEETIAEVERRLQSGMSRAASAIGMLASKPRG